MDFIDRLRELAARIQKRLAYVQTEESTKNSLVMPFINSVLEYNVFDPTEVLPEFTADVGTKKGEKVDYAVLKDGKPIMLFECKRYGADLDKEQASQLFRYFSVTEARFAVLTDGVVYRFFSDLEQPNKMDPRPFLEFNLLDIQEPLVEELKKFSKTSFDLEDILATASELKYTREIKKILADEWGAPSDDFVRFFASQVYAGHKTKAVIEQFTPITNSAFHQFVSDRISDRLKSALAEETAAASQAIRQEPGVPAETAMEEEEEEGEAVVTTEEELQGYYLVKSILREVIDPKRVFMRDVRSYCGILLDNNNRKPICRLHFNAPQKQLGLFDENKREERVPIQDVDDIYGHAERIKATVSFYEHGQQDPAGQALV
jgi:hypothetical protein